MNEAQGRALIKAAFPENPVVACAVADAEGFPNNLGINFSHVEHSVGWFQINLFAWDSRRVPKAQKDKENPLPAHDTLLGLTWEQIHTLNPRAKKVHWDKARGNTLGEKTAWLQKPENNIAVGRMIFKGRRNTFSAWSAFTIPDKNGVLPFTRHLESCR